MDRRRVHFEDDGSREAADDRMLPLTRGVALLVTAILAAAGVVLYLLPHETERLWAWPMTPEMTALAVGGGYLAGAVLFFRAGRQSCWHRVGVVFPAATVLTVLLLVATLVHWDRFSHGHLSFWTWLVVYVITPVLLPIVWLTNRRRDPRRPVPGSPVVPRWVRTLIGAAGAVQMTVALAFFVRPAAAMAVWPWELTPLTARTIASFVAFIGAVWLAFVFEARWSALQLHVEGAMLGLALVALGALRGADDLTGRPLETAVFAVLLGGTLAGLLALLVGMRRAAPAEATAAARSDASPDDDGSP